MPQVCPPNDSHLNRLISEAIVALYAAFYGHDRATATTYINDNVVVWVLDSILPTDEDAKIANGERVRSSMAEWRFRPTRRMSSPLPSNG
jgi:uncharacterized protein YbcI